MTGRKPFAFGEEEGNPRRDQGWLVPQVLYCIVLNKPLVPGGPGKGLGLGLGLEAPSPPLPSLPSPPPAVRHLLPHLSTHLLRVFF